MIAVVPLVCALSGDVTAGQWVRREFTELHMGMAVRIVVHAQYDSAARAGARAAFATIASLEDVMSDYRPASELRRLTVAANAASIEVSADLCAVLDAGLTFARLSDGAFDPTVGPLVALWRAARQTGTPPSLPAIAEARSRVGWSRVRLDPDSCTATLDPGVQLDLGGIAKGYVLDRALATLAERGITSALIEAGGDIVVGDPPPGARGWRIVVRDGDPAVVSRAASLANAAISTSGDAEQFVANGGRRYSHIIDPRTGLGSTTAGLVTVIARDAMTADAMATALVVLGPERGTSLLGYYRGVVAAYRTAVVQDRSP